MTTVAPPPATPPTTPPSTPPPTTVTVPDAPEALLRLPVGTTLDVRLLATTLRGAVEAESALGKLLMRTPLPLPKGAEATLQLVSIGRTQAVLRVVTLAGKPLALALPDLFGTGQPGRAGSVPANPATAPGRPPPGQQTVSTTGRDTVTVSAQSRLPTEAPGTLLRAIVLRPGNALAHLNTGSRGQTMAFGNIPAPGAATLAALSGLKTNSILTVRLVGIGLGAPQSAPSLPQSQPATPGLTAPTPQTATSGVGAGPATAAPTGGTPTTPTGPAAPGTTGVPPAPARPLMLSGLITAQGAPGQPLLRTAVGLMALDGGPALPPGTRVTVEIIAQQPPQAVPAQALPPGVPPLPGTPAFTNTLPTLTQALEQIARLDPEAATHLLARLPADDPRLLVNALAFVQAARSGDVRGWVGERAAKTLEKVDAKGRSLLDRLGDEVQPRILPARESGGGDWRVLQMPFMVGGAIERIALVTRREGPQDDTEDDARGRRRNGEPGQRFLVDLNLTQLGALQLDGLYKTQSRSLDIVVRTCEAWPEDVRRGLLGVFARAAQTLNIKGGVTFQVSEVFQGPIMPTPDGPQDGLGWIA